MVYQKFDEMGTPIDRMNLKLIEQYDEVVERDSSQISYSWKGSVMLAYFLGSLSSYTCVTLFYVFWHDMCGNHCLFWAEVILEPNTWVMGKNGSIVKIREVNNNNNIDYDWTHEILVVSQLDKYCQWFLFGCMLSCVFAVTFFTMFAICGKGGYDKTLFFAPWRIVLPALISSLIMMLVTMKASYEFIQGYFHFSDNLYRFAYLIKQATSKPFKYAQQCEVFQEYIKNHNLDHYDSCSTYLIIEFSSRIMAWSWISIVFILCLRILTSVDFNLLKVKIYRMPQEEPARETVLKKINQARSSIETEGARSSTEDTDKIKQA